MQQQLQTDGTGFYQSCVISETSLISWLEDFRSACVFQYLGQKRKKRNDALILHSSILNVLWPLLNHICAGNQPCRSHLPLVNTPTSTTFSVHQKKKWFELNDIWTQNKVLSHISIGVMSFPYISWLQQFSSLFFLCILIHTASSEQFI